MIIIAHVQVGNYLEQDLKDFLEGLKYAILDISGKYCIKIQNVQISKEEI